MESNYEILRILIGLSWRNRTTYGTGSIAKCDFLNDQLSFSTRSTSTLQGIIFK